MPRAELISTAAAAADLDVHRSTLTRMVKAGKIKPAVKGTGQTGEMFFHPSEIARVRARRGTPTEPTSTPTDVAAAAPAPTGAAAPSEDGAA